MQLNFYLCLAVVNSLVTKQVVQKGLTKNDKLILGGVGATVVTGATVGGIVYHLNKKGDLQKSCSKQQDKRIIRKM